VRGQRRALPAAIVAVGIGDAAAVHDADPNADADAVALVRAGADSHPDAVHNASADANSVPVAVIPAQAHPDADAVAIGEAPDLATPVIVAEADANPNPVAVAEAADLAVPVIVAEAAAVETAALDPVVPAGPGPVRSGLRRYPEGPEQLRDLRPRVQGPHAGLLAGHLHSRSVVVAGLRDRRCGGAWMHRRGAR
jgi:hypothetical protein